jgi:hypothetical protein
MPAARTINKNYVPYVFDPNNIPKHGIVVSLPVNTRGAPHIREEARSRYGIRSTHLPHNGHYISVLDAERINYESIVFVNRIQGFVRIRDPHYSPDMKWEDIWHGDKNFPYHVYVGKVASIHPFPEYISPLADPNDKDTPENGSFFFINQVFPRVDAELIAKINGFAGAEVVARDIWDDHYIHGSNMTEDLWNTLIAEQIASGFVGYFNPDRLKQIRAKVLYEHGPRKPYKRVRVIFGRE